MSFIVIKDKKSPNPNDDFLRRCFEIFGKNVSFSYSFNEENYVFKNYTDLDLFLNELKKDFMEEIPVIFIFQNKIEEKQFPLSISSEQIDCDVFKTKDQIIFCEKNLEGGNESVLKKLVGFDFKKHISIFDMIVPKNNSVILNNNGEYVKTGLWLQKNKYHVSGLLSEIKSNESIFTEKPNEKTNYLNFSILKRKTETCLYCESKENLEIIDEIITVCKDCSRKLNSFKCGICKRVFCGLFYNYPNICSECNQSFSISKISIFAIHSVKFKTMDEQKRRDEIKTIRNMSYSELSKKIYKDDKELQKTHPKTYDSKLKNLFEIIQKNIEIT